MCNVIRQSLVILIFLFIISGLKIQPVHSQAGFDVSLIAQDDQARQKGIMILCPPGSPCVSDSELDFIARYKIGVSVNGVGEISTPPEITSIACTVIQKEVCFVPSDKPGGRQFDVEIEATFVVDISNRFVCKVRSLEGTPGTGVVDVYFIGPRNSVFIGDNVLRVNVEATDESGDQVFSGSAIQDLCILGFPVCRGLNTCPAKRPTLGAFLSAPNFVFQIPTPDDDLTLVRFADPLYAFASCENAALWERHVLGRPLDNCPN